MIARIAMASVLAALVACGSRDATVAPTASAPPAASSSTAVRWQPARSPTGTPLLEAPARIVAAPEGRAIIAPPLRARILAVVAVVGREVVAGTPLVEVALPEAASAAASYLAAADQIAAHTRRQAQLEELRREGMARTADLATIELELARLRGERDIAASALRAANLKVEDAGALAARGGRMMLRAPRAGTIMRMTAVLGAAASPDEPLVELAAGGSTRVEATLAYPLPEGASFVVDTAAGSSVVRLATVGPSREADGTTRAWFDAETPLPAGALGTLRARLPAGAAVTVPATAVDRDDQGTFVWRRAGEKPQRAPVRVLATSGTQALVSGVKEGEPIASSAQAIAADGGAP